MNKPDRKMVDVVLMDGIKMHSTLNEIVAVIREVEFLFPDYLNMRMKPSNTSLSSLSIIGQRPQTDVEYNLYCDYVAAEEARHREYGRKERAEYERLKCIFGD